MERGSEVAPLNTGMQVRIWGARGSVPTPTAENLRVGGNTPCVEVQVGEESFVFDAGTGIRNLGLQHAKRIEEHVDDLHVFLTHFHWDHVQGLPFFVPLYSPANTVTFHSGFSAEHLRDVLSGQMMNPYFPVRFDMLEAQRKFAQMGEAPEMFGNASVCAFELSHPGRAFGYRVDAGGARVVYATDHEHGDAAADARLREMASGADVLIYDAQFTPEEYATKTGWGHSTWLEATRVAKDAGVKRLVLFHHDPEHTDEEMERICEAARREFAATEVAIEGMVLAAGGDSVKG